MTGGEAVVHALTAHGVDTVFGIPGGHNLSVYDALLEAMLLHGHRPGGNFDGVRVLEDKWREVAKGMQLSDGGPEAQRKAFYRAARELVTKHIISKKDGFIGLLERDIERDIMRDMADRQITAEIQEF